MPSFTQTYDVNLAIVKQITHSITTCEAKMAETICLLPKTMYRLCWCTEWEDTAGYDAVIMQNYRHWQHSVCSQCPHIKFYHGLTLNELSHIIYCPERSHRQILINFRIDVSHNVSQKALRFIYLFIFINTPRSAAAQFMIIKCIPEVELQRLV